MESLASFDAFAKRRQGACQVFQSSFSLRKNVDGGCAERTRLCSPRPASVSSRFRNSVAHARYRAHLPCANFSMAFTKFSGIRRMRFAIAAGEAAMALRSKTVLLNTRVERTLLMSILSPGVSASLMPAMSAQVRNDRGKGNHGENQRDPTENPHQTLYATARAAAVAFHSASVLFSWRHHGRCRIVTRLNYIVTRYNRRFVAPCGIDAGDGHKIVAQAMESRAASAIGRGRVFSR